MYHIGQNVQDKLQKYESNFPFSFGSGLSDLKPIFRFGSRETDIMVLRLGRGRAHQGKWLSLSLSLVVLDDVANGTIGIAYGRQRWRISTEPACSKSSAAIFNSLDNEIGIRQK
ncbi:hypothetical protein CEXT_129451 [Caerostris extrusa]|uniref:Uncharacterized protein n=1 Tax=Caerostris extrusa TaxID=172846 RepID=A0AAV4S2I2_CAEEX|nr:hypothetical protein CEXT_129451 [Caerostris extrusa]